MMYLTGIKGRHISKTLLQSKCKSDKNQSQIAGKYSWTSRRKRKQEILLAYIWWRVNQLFFTAETQFYDKTAKERIEEEGKRVFGWFYDFRVLLNTACPAEDSGIKNFIIHLRAADKPL